VTGHHGHIASAAQFNGRVHRRERAKALPRSFKRSWYRRCQNRCRPGFDLDPDLGQLTLDRRRPGLGLDRDLAEPNNYQRRGRRKSLVRHEAAIEKATRKIARKVVDEPAG
jgi:hypothetical protein